MVKTNKELRDLYLRSDLLPSVFCPGCGNGQVINYTIRAIDDLGLSKDNIVLVSGIGCSSRIPAYFDTDGIHATHGRAIAFATGVKVTNPNLNVIVFTGDGDLAAIGLNHFLHAIRRNINITVICINNGNYGMTGGQASPTTPMGSFTATTPYKSIEHSFNLSFLAKAAGALYVARYTTAHSRQCIEAIKKGLMKKGFAFIEIISPCPVSRKRFRSATEYINYYLENSIKYTEDVKDETSCYVFNSIEQSFTTDYEGKIIIGEIVNIDKPDFHVLYKKLKERARSEFWKSKE
ncbi:MAG: 2-oxoacid:ferredoxin oxidoreductase subunit beta [Candidatus Helarchaeota archaeon]